MLALVVAVPASEAELAADALWALGVMAVEERDPQPDGGDASSVEDHYVELWTSLGDDDREITRAAEGFPTRWRWRLAEVDDDIVDTWRQHAVPSWITPDLVVVPSWIDVTVDPGVTAISIDPGAAFGLGDHPTTVLSIRALTELVWPSATMLDVGCGSGVLGIAGALLGASYVEAIDISIAAIAATAGNAARNGVDGQIHVSSQRLDEVTDDFDVVVANILAPALIEMAGDLRRVTRPAGVLVVSGLLDGVYEHVVEALAPMQLTDVLRREGWAALVMRH